MLFSAGEPRDPRRRVGRLARERRGSLQMTELRAAPGTSTGGRTAGSDDDVHEHLFHRHLMEDMLFARRASERLWNLQRQGRITTIAPLTGQEAAIVGVVRALDLAHDWL